MGAGHLAQSTAILSRRKTALLQRFFGSYIGWLEAILSHLTGRYDERELEGLSDAEALEAVYNYAAVYKVALTDETAPHVAEVCGNDPWYIASTASAYVKSHILKES